MFLVEKGMHVVEVKQILYRPGQAPRFPER
jgi:hypothetical protein